jgi:hypothetical protein
MEAWETIEYRGHVIELHTDLEPSPPSDWDNVGTLVAFSNLSRRYTFAEEEADGTAEDAVDRGGPRLLTRYLRLCRDEFAVPFQFHDGPYAGRVYDLDPDEPEGVGVSGYIYTTHKRLTELCGDDPKYHTREWAEEALKGDLKNWDAYAEGRVAGYVVSGPVCDDSLWGYYPDEEGDGYEELRREAKAAVDRAIAWEREQVQKISRAMAI